ncbi:MAG: acetate kinase [Armatimonadota bacterium]|nr:acetate kinase [Armatimonadota bacterium]
MKVLVLNSGSSSLKYQLIDSESEEVLAKGIAERIGVKGGGGKIKHETAKNGAVEVEVDMADHDQAMDRVFKLLTDPQHGAITSVQDISAVGHRVVHGGERFVEPTVVDDVILAEIDKMSVLAPLHNPANLKGIKACMRLMPGVPQVAVFDTAFHATMPDYAYIYALPYNYYTDYGVRRYGFHGTSHRYVAGQALKLLAERGVSRESSKLITCHLGNGCSMTAIVGGRVVDTSMGMTPAEGLVMGTRSGDIDPAVLLYLARELRATPDEIDDLINKRSGLLGISGISSDMRDIQKAAAEGNRRAELALSIFCYRVKKYIGAYAAAMGGLDAVVFTGGIGENSSEVRSRVCNGLEFLGIELDEKKNRSAQGLSEICAPTSRVRLFVIPTNEERMIARETVEVLQSQKMGAAVRG